MQCVLCDVTKAFTNTLCLPTWLYGCNTQIFNWILAEIIADHQEMDQYHCIMLWMETCQCQHFNCNLKLGQRGPSAKQWVVLTIASCLPACLWRWSHYNFLESFPQSLQKSNKDGDLPLYILVEGKLSVTMTKFLVQAGWRQFMLKTSRDVCPYILLAGMVVGMTL